MTLTAAQITNGGSTTDASSYTSSSITPVADRLYLLAVVSSHGSATPNQPTVSGNGLTWARALTVTFDTVATPLKRLTLFRALKSSGVTSGTFTIDFAGQTQTGCRYSLLELTPTDLSGSDGSGAIADSGTAAGDASSSGSITFTGSGGPNDGTFSCWAIDANAAITHESGYTEHFDGGYNTPTTRLETQSKVSSLDTTPSASWSSADYAGIGVRVRLFEALAAATADLGLDATAAAKVEALAAAAADLGLEATPAAREEAFGAAAADLGLDGAAAALVEVLAAAVAEIVLEAETPTARGEQLAQAAGVLVIDAAPLPVIWRYVLLGAASVPAGVPGTQEFQADGDALAAAAAGVREDQALATTTQELATMAAGTP
jgi:hypothetical protein